MNAKGRSTIARIIEAGCDRGRELTQMACMKKEVTRHMVKLYLGGRPIGHHIDS